MTGQRDPYEELDHAIEALRSERHPSLEAHSSEELDLLKMAAALHGSRKGADAARPDLRARIQATLAGAGQPPAAPPAAVTRRRLVIGGMASAAAGLLAGIGLDRFASARPPIPSIPSPIPPPPERELVETNGSWFTICAAQEIPAGKGKRFRMGAIEGFIANIDGQMRACAAICTHMGCVLTHRPEQGDLFCPCHGAQFHPDGSIKRGGRTLKQLPPLRVKQENGDLMVWCVPEMPPPSTG